MELNSIWEALAANSNAFEHSVAAKLIQHEWSIDFAGPLFVVWNNATNKVGIRVAKSVHQLGQLVFVKLRHGSEHSFASSSAKLRITA